MVTTADGHEIPTHIRGDAHAAAIIAGRYPRARAEQDHTAAVAMARALVRGTAALTALLQRIDGRPWASRR